jgi:hypothetical protein
MRGVPMRTLPSPGATWRVSRRWIAKRLPSARASRGSPGSHAGGADRFPIAAADQARGARSPDDQVNADSGTPTTWPRRAQALASAAPARVCVTRSLAASCAGAPRSAARRRRWSSGSLAVARAKSASSGAFGSSPPFSGSHRPVAICGGCPSAPLETCARRVPYLGGASGASRVDPRWRPGCVPALLVIRYATSAFRSRFGEGLVAGTAERRGHPWPAGPPEAGAASGFACAVLPELTPRFDVRAAHRVESMACAHRFTNRLSPPRRGA